MATLTGVSISSSYTSLLKLDGNTDSTAAGNGSNAIQVKTGDNEATPLFLNTDRLGIGTANVQSPLHIFSTINNTFSDTISATDFTGDVLTIENKPASSNDDYVSIAMSTSGSQFVSSRIVLDNDGSGAGALNFQLRSPGDLSNTTTFMKIKSTGDVEIPSGKLNARGGLNSVHAMFSGQDNRGLLIETQVTTNNDDTVVLNAQTSSGEIAFETNSTERMRLTSTGLGIGGTPSRKLESINTSAGADTLLLQLRNNSSNTSTSSSLRFVNSTSGTSSAGGAEISAIRNANDGGSLTIKTAQDSSATLTTALTIDSSQNLGIGISDGDGKVHIHSGTAGAVTAQTSGNDLVVESSSNAGISILSPDAQKSRLYFGSTNNNNIGNIGGFYNSGAFQLFFNISGTDRFIIDGNSRISLSNNDAGGTGGTDSTSGNTLFGFLAGSSIQDTSIDNTYIGHKAGASTTTADNNVAIGARALFSTTIAGSTVAVGELAGYSVTDHGNNVYIGHTAGYHQTGESNIFIGKDAGLGASGSSAQDGITAFGFKSLESLTSGSKNTAVGYQSGNTVTTGQKNVLIGYDADVSGAGATNQIVIGADTTAVSENSVTLGNTGVTDVYMAQDSGATVHCAGIDFSASQSAPDAGTSTSEVLDGYEEGTWTPVLSDGTNNFTMASNQNANYTKVGRAVHFNAEFGTGSIGSASGALLLTGLPFTSASSTSEGCVNFGFIRKFNYSSNAIQLSAMVNGGATTISFFESVDDSTEVTVQCSQADFAGTGFFMRISGTYFV